LVFAQTAMSKGKTTEASAATARAKLFAERSHDKSLEIAARLQSARIEAAVGDPSRREAAARNLRNLAQEANAAGYQYPSCEARLALGILEMEPHGSGSGRAQLTNLHREASSVGFTLIADRAASQLRIQ